MAPADAHTSMSINLTGDTSAAPLHGVYQRKAISRSVSGFPDDDIPSAPRRSNSQGESPPPPPAPPPPFPFPAYASDSVSLRHCCCTTHAYFALGFRPRPASGCAAERPYGRHLWGGKKAVAAGCGPSLPGRVSQTDKRSSPAKY